MMKVEDQGGFPKVLPSVGQDACADCLLCVQEGEDVVEKAVW